MLFKLIKHLAVFLFIFGLSIKSILAETPLKVKTKNQFNLLENNNFKTNKQQNSAGNKFLKSKKIEQKQAKAKNQSIKTVAQANNIKVKSNPKKNNKTSPSSKKIFILSQKKVLKEVLNSSPYIQKIKLTRQKYKSQLLEKKYSFSDWAIFSSWNQSERKNPQITAFESKRKETQIWSTGLEKKLPYGLNISSVYNQSNESQIHSDFLQRIQQPNEIYRKNLSLELKANLTSALANHWTLDTIDQKQSTTDWLYYEQAEQLALKSAGQYWKTYLSYIAYQQAQQGLKTYRKLVRQINSKKKYNFLNPGERPQILAEYQNIQQFADKQKQNYEKEKKALFILLKKNPDKYDIEFKEDDLTPLPSFSKIKIENTREIKIKQSQISQQKLTLKTKQALLFPNLQFSSKGGWIPAGLSSDLEFSPKQSFYEIGVSLSWPLFSKSFYEKVNQEKYQLEENKIDFKIAKQELKNQLNQIENEIKSAYKNINHASKSAKYQKQAFRELQKSFDQGRVDIFELINIENKLRESEIKKKQVLSEYSLLILQLQALKDQLVDDYLSDSKN